jgi:hypothetical protein
MSLIQRKRVAAESLKSAFSLSDVNVGMIAQSQCLQPLELVGANEWKRLLQEKGLLTEDERDLIDCLLEAVHQVRV